MRIRATALIAICCAIALVAGCGGSSSGEGTSTTGGSGEATGTGADATTTNAAAKGQQVGPGTLSSRPIAKAAFIAKADRVCKGSDRTVGEQAFAALQEGEGQGESRLNIEEALITELLIPTLELEVKHVREIGTPKGDKAKIEAILQAMEGVIEEAETDPLSFVQAAGGHYKLGRYHYRKSIPLAEKYGLEICGY